MPRASRLIWRWLSRSRRTHCQDVPEEVPVVVVIRLLVGLGEAKLVEKIMIMRKAKYPRAVIPRNASVKSASRANIIILMIRELTIRLGYDAFACSLVRTSIEPRFVTVETEISAAWKLSKIHLLLWKRCWKYGPAAKNMFQAHSIDTPSKRKMLYSIQENARCLPEV
ncbi:hypothetical protein KC324_g41 [Hortaea werneckii]|nr:hypothetical protein KC324_g41 [Hortaea werneckii]